jgi:hypothetical protein
MFFNVTAQFLHWIWEFEFNKSLRLIRRIKSADVKLSQLL